MLAVAVVHPPPLFTKLLQGLFLKSSVDTCVCVRVCVRGVCVRARYRMGVCEILCARPQAMGVYEYACVCVREYHCVWVCVCTCTNVWMGVYGYVCARARAYGRVRVCVRVCRAFGCVWVCAHVCTSAWVCMVASSCVSRVYLHAGMGGVYLCVRVCAFVRVGVCMRVCLEFGEGLVVFGRMPPNKLCE